MIQWLPRSRSLLCQSKNRRSGKLRNKTNLKQYAVQPQIYENTIIQFTLPKTNMDTQNECLEKVTPNGNVWYLC